MREWKNSEIFSLIDNREKLNQKEMRIFCCLAGATISIYRKRSQYKAYFLAKITGCLCCKSIYSELSESLDILERIMGAKINWKLVAEGTQGDTEWNRGAEEIVMRYRQQKLCHVDKTGLICYCDEHGHKRGE